MYIRYHLQNIALQTFWHGPQLYNHSIIFEAQLYLHGYYSNTESRSSKWNHRPLALPKIYIISSFIHLLLPNPLNCTGAGTNFNSHRVSVGIAMDCLLVCPQTTIHSRTYGQIRYVQTVHLN